MGPSFHFENPTLSTMIMKLHTVLVTSGNCITYNGGTGVNMPYQRIIIVEPNKVIKFSAILCISFFFNLSARMVRVRKTNWIQI